MLLCLTEQDGTLETDTNYYKMSETAIKDKSVLGTEGQKLCENLDVYWMTQTCDGESDERKCCRGETRKNVNMLLTNM